MEDQEPKPVWVQCLSTTLTASVAGGKTHEWQAREITLGKKYRVLPSDVEDGQYVTILNDTEIPQIYRSHLFTKACEPPTPEELRKDGFPVSVEFVIAVHREWGSTRRVAKAALKEMSRIGGRWSETSDEDHVENAILIGVLVGKHFHGTPQAFIKAFRHIND